MPHPVELKLGERSAEYRQQYRLGEIADIRRLRRYNITTSLLHVLPTPSLAEGAVIVQVDIQGSGQRFSKLLKISLSSSQDLPKIFLS